MADLISRAAAIAEVMQMVELHRHEIFRGELLHYTGIKAMIEALPAVDVAPVVHGRWIHLDPRERATISGKCSCCGWEAHYYEDDVADMPYCPNCGARMDGETNG